MTPLFFYLRNKCLITTHGLGKLRNYVSRAKILKKRNSCLKTFDEIPGPKGLPGIGTLLEYKEGTHIIE